MQNIANSGARRGEHHPRAEYTDHEIEQVREARARGMSWKQLVRVFDMSKRHIRNVCNLKVRLP